MGKDLVISEHEFATKSVMNLIIKYSGITLIGMLAQVIMVVFEGIIIGNGLGSNGFACVELAMPLEYLQLAIGGAFGIGISTVAAVRLGNGDKAGAREAFGKGICFSTFFILIIAALIAIFAHPMAVLLGTPKEYMDTMVTFIRIFMIGYPFCIIAQSIVCFFRLDQKPALSTAALTTTAILGVIWLYINCYHTTFGIVGTAWYYAFSIGGWAFFGIYFLVSKKTIFKFRKSDLKMDWKLNLKMMKVGLPYFLVQVSSTIFSIIVNNVITSNSANPDIDLAAYAVINGYIIYILMMITQSITQGTQPIISFNLGDKHIDRVRKLMNQSMVTNIIAVGIFTAIFIIFSHQVCFVFCGAGDLLETASAVTKIAICCAMLGSCSMVMSCYYQAIERIAPSVVLGLCRYLLFCVPVMLVLTSVLGMGTQGVWVSLPIADVLAFVLSLILMLREIKRLSALA